MGILSKTKTDLSDGIKAMNQNKKLNLENEKLKKRLDDFNQKKEKEINSYKQETQNQKNNKNGYHARVQLFLTSGSSKELIADLGAFFGHKEGKQTLKVINKDKEVIFEEIKPDWQNTYNFSDEATLKKKIIELKETLKKFQNGEIVEKKDKKTNMVYYQEDYVAMLRESEQKYAIKILGAEGSYSIIHEGIPVYSFDIIGFFKIPLFHYSQSNILGIPPAPKIIAGQYIMDVLYKDYKSDETKAQRFAMILGIIIGLVMVLAGTYMMYHSANMVDSISVNLNSASHSLANLLNYSDSLNQISSQINQTNSILNQNVINRSVQNLTTIIK